METTIRINGYLYPVTGGDSANESNASNQVEKSDDKVHLASIEMSDDEIRRIIIDSE